MNPKPSENQALTLDTLWQYLLEGHLVSAQALVEDPLFDIQDRSRRNTNLAVLAGPDRLLVKQPRGGGGAAASTVDMEARVLQIVTNDPVFEPVRWCIPAFHHYEPERHILVAELVHPATTLSKFFLNGGDIDLDAEAAGFVGRVMADVHQAFARAHRRGILPFVADARDTAFGWADAALSNWDNVEEGRRELVRRLERSGVMDLRAEAIQALKTRSTPVHNDPRWDNFILTSGGSRTRPLNLRMIDWETLRLGDAAHDVAFFINEFHRFWVGSATFSDHEGQQVKRQLFDLEDSKPAVRAFLDAYLARRRITGDARLRFLARVRLYLPLVIVNMAVEMTQGQDRLLPGAARALETARRIKEDRVAGAARFFGVPTDVAEPTAAVEKPETGPGRTGALVEVTQ